MGPAAAPTGTAIRVSSAKDFRRLLVAQAWPGFATHRIARCVHHDNCVRWPAVGLGDPNGRDWHGDRRYGQRDVELLPHAALAAGWSWIGRSNGTPSPSLRVDLVAASNGRHADRNCRAVVVDHVKPKHAKHPVGRRDILALRGHSFRDANYAGRSNLTGCADSVRVVSEAVERGDPAGL